MGNHKSAVKRHRQSLVKKERNRRGRSTIRSAAKDVQAAVKSGDKQKAQELLREATRLLDKAAIKGLLHKKNAARRVSRLAKLTATAK
jgi:small subunit ribosomal protein S20